MGEIKPIHFEGVIPSSKSLMNRALICQSFFSDLKVQGETFASDVLCMRKALDALSEGQTEFDCGEGGTTFRFLVTRLSRENGSFSVKTSSRLAERPHQDLFRSLEVLGTKIRKKSDCEFEIESIGWNRPEGPIEISMTKSSQFASALLLSSWELPFDISYSLTGEQSRSYLDMTVELLKQLGMVIIENSKEIVVPKGQRVLQKEILIEPDMSSAFSVAAHGALRGRACFHNFPNNSLQPDFRFLEILSAMGASVSWEGRNLIVEKNSLHGIDCNLTQNPDLFPVLSILMSFAKGNSTLTGTEVLKHKESDRLRNILGLLDQAGVEFQQNGDSISISGVNQRAYPHFEFDPDQDHRMAMAASLFVGIEILNQNVVNKSFPGFWKAIEK